MAEMQEPAEAEEPEERPLHFRPVEFRIRLKEEDREKFERRLKEELEAFDQELDQRLNWLREWRRAWEHVPAGTANRWEGCSDLPSHLTRVYCNSHQTRLNTQIVNANPPFVAVAKRQDAIDAAPPVEEALLCYLDEANWAQVADDLHGELAATGNCYLKTYWERRFERIPERRVVTDDDRMKALALAGAPMHDAMYRSVKRLKLVHKEVPVYDGVAYKVIPFEDGLIFPATARRPEDCYAIGECYAIRGATLRQMVDDGFLEDEAVEELLERDSDPVPEYRMDRLEDIGVTPTYANQYDDSDYRCYNLIELDWLGDFDGDGKHEWATLFYHEESGKLLGIRWKEAEHPGPRYDLFRYIVRPGELFGMGIAELVAPLQAADGAVLNQIVDAQDLAIALSRSFIHSSMSGVDVEEFQAKMGLWLKADNINEIREFPRLQFPQEAYQLRQSYKDAGDLLTASSNPGLGKTTDSSKTLGEVQIVFGAANMVFEDYAARVSRTWAKPIDKTRWLVAQYGLRDDQTGEVVYRSTAAPAVEFKSIPPELLKAAIDFVPAGLNQLSDMQTRLQQATLARSTFMNHPLVAINPPAGIWNWEALRILDDMYQRSLKLEQGKKLMSALDKQAAAQMGMQQMEAMMGGMVPPGAPPGPPGAPPPEGAMPEAGPEAGGPPAIPEEATALAGGQPPPMPVQ